MAVLPAVRPQVGRTTAVVPLLGLQDLLQLPVVEEDPPAVLALLQAHPGLVDGTQRPMAFRTCHPISIRRSPRRRGAAPSSPGAGSPARPRPPAGPPRS